MYILKRIVHRGTFFSSQYIQPATFCDDYPVTSYTLIVSHAGVASSKMRFTSLENAITARNLSENTIYIYQLSATNSVGTTLANFTQDVCKLITS